MKLMKVKELRNKCHALKFEGVEILEQYTNNELRKICNGIGPEFFPEKWRKIITWIFKYLEATAFLHDVEFHTQIGFGRANAHFFINGIREVKAKFKWYNPFRYIGLHRVRQFCYLLKIFGIFAYENANLENIKKEKKDD